MKRKEVRSIFTFCVRGECNLLLIIDLSIIFIVKQQAVAQITVGKND
jgi:hypothetical protein